ncbi:MAG: amidase, partial [Thermoleophilaceae bacterium]|nr:amidase [Thermoleophilaceae bacterium]
MPVRYRSALAIADEIHAGELSAREVMGETLDRIDALDLEYGAFTHVDHEGAMETARKILPRDPRPFAGVPIAIKDLTAVKEMPLSFGSEFGHGYIPPAEGFTVAKLRAAGFVILGKTATPEFGIQPVTEPAAFGPTRNPWDR